MAGDLKRGAAIITAPKCAHKNPRNGTTDAGMNELAMRFYCARERRKYKDWQDIYSVPFKYKLAANFLSQHLKFGWRTIEWERRLRYSAM